MTSALGLGGLMFGSYGGADLSESTRMVHAALDAGINLIDTADGYSGGESEEHIGVALKGRRDNVIISTKVGMPIGGDNERGASRRWITRQVERSLRRLGTDWIDIYQIHSFDDLTPLEETLGALADLVQAGKILYTGSSNFPVERIVEAQWASSRTGLVRFSTEQLQYSLLDRRAESALLPTCARHGVAALVWGGLNGGWLTGKFDARDRIPSSGNRYERVRAHYDPDAVGNREKASTIEQLRSLAANAGMSMVELSLRFCVSHPAVGAALLGPKSMSELTESLPALAGTLDGALLDEIDRVVAPGALVGRDHQTPAEWLEVPVMRRA